MDLRRRYMGIVLFSAFVVAVESVGVEAAINTFEIGSYMVAAVPSTVGGLILLAVMPRDTFQVMRTLRGRGWLLLTTTCAFISAGVFLWFDAVGRIGASKEAILGGGSSEVLFIVLLSALFLSERLTKVEIIGSVMILMGVLIVLTNAEDLSLTLGLGEIEAIVSSFFLAISVVLTTILLRTYKLAPVSGLELIVPGVMMLVLGLPLGLIHWPGLEGTAVLVGIGCFPAVGILTYNAGLPKIGASLTSVLFALVGIMAVGVQLSVLAAAPHANIILPGSLPLALMGGATAFAGVYLLNLTPGVAKGGAHPSPFPLSPRE